MTAILARQLEFPSRRGRGVGLRTVHVTGKTGNLALCSARIGKCAETQDPVDCGLCLRMFPHCNRSVLSTPTRSNPAAVAGTGR